MKLLLFLPLIIPLATAVAGLFAWNRRELQRLLGVCGTTALLGAGVALLTVVQRQGVVSVQAGNWPAPFGITLVADLFSAVMVVVVGAMGLAVAVYSLASADIDHESLGYHPLMQVLLLGVCGSLLTGDLFNLYVWFEVMLIASFVLLALGGRRQQMEGAIKYVALNLIASAFFLAGIGILYGVAGTLNMADLARQLRAVPHGGTVPVIAALLFAAFGIKSAVFPLFFWLPASYHTPPVAVTTIFSALLTKVGVYVLVRIFTLIFVQEAEAGRTLILAAAGLTMVTGVLGAVAQHEMRRLLSFHIVSQIGYLVMGLGLLTPLALAGTIFFMVHVIAAKSALFLVAGIVKRLTGTTELAELGGLYEGRPLVAGLFLVPALALAGIPPLSGFWAKLALVRAGLGEGRYVVVAAALAVSILTLFSMTKIWAEAFWKDHPVREGEAHAQYHPHIPGGARLLLGVPALVLALATVAMGVGAEPLFRLSLTAADQLLNPDLYIAAVLGVKP
ncbi:Na+/H+ antiporter subunit D [Geobacter sulfurreducens]|uniref:Sodium/proton antiporter complex Mrp, protein D n=1 Tax=Geobacter sulfurreducens (strain ATCC 51573 / DSM 12127 / PCA) TaxID=243231 RepID=Q74AL2_GEOSL|nr:Na+/H+ antiporter subunit D [Geobacter sulfurreducens]AAR35716.1 sodium/proton antiporter complex Mrp, protein D [Geobacter sulfurreducens PCA]UAC03048.1 Na+/H+ antiporter subunit D [Geobacter sulfurreducens]HBB68887.1 Na+/H+ antiporter subunit D [Geobacter sulfurreducens]HCD95101.1 Na+/H+ antiporter subunit D [Geobacter sulfurreducens]